MTTRAINPEQPVTLEHHRAEARRDFAAGKPRDAHGLPWNSNALSVYLREYDKQANLARLAANRRGVPAP